jgi:hypothetical protein
MYQGKLLFVEQTQCGNGHEYNDTDTYYHNGKKYCRICRKATSKRIRMRAKQYNRLFLEVDNQGEEWDVIRL